MRWLHRVRHWFRRRPSIKYLNAAQTQAIMHGLGPEPWELLREYGYLQGGGIVQEEDGEVVLLAIYREGELCHPPPQTWSGFRIKAEQRPPAVG